MGYYDLGRAVMPLVKVLRDAQLSWSEREQIADAILAAWRAHKSMADEEAHLAQGACGGQQSYEAAFSGLARKRQ